MEKINCPICEKPIFSACFKDGNEVKCPYCKEIFILKEKMRKRNKPKKE